MTSLLTVHAQHWDFAGIDGLQVAQNLFGDAIGRLAPFQSAEISLTQGHCSVLRLCEGNFRVGWQGEPEIFQQQMAQAHSGRRVWVKQLPWLSVLFLAESAGLLCLPQIAIPKPPYRLQAMPLNCAIPARIDGMSVLVWHHPINAQPVFELHMAVQHLQPIRAVLLTTEMGTPSKLAGAIQD
ncbi:MAG: hypothetical protein HC827_20235 [Cyanobacteria bacterium RM1_2_2]|nr:hypothetical protein [Cyanobacteria bacterium RM1_2_2]